MCNRMLGASWGHLLLRVALVSTYLLLILGALPGGAVHAQASADMTKDIIVGVRREAKIGEINKFYRTVTVEQIRRKAVYRLRVTMPSPVDPVAFLDLLSQMNMDGRRGILYAVADQSDVFSGSSVPFDNYIWSLLGPGDVSAQPAMAQIGLGVTQPRTATGAGVTVAVIDSGFNANHPFLHDAWAPSTARWDYLDGDNDPEDRRDGVDGDGDGQVDESFGHGVFVAGIVHAVAMDARIAPYRVVDNEGRVRDRDVANAIGRAVIAGVRVINLSLVIPGNSPVLSAAIQQAAAAGVLVVASAGNAASGAPSYPAADPCAVSVTAVDATGALAPFANYGSDVDLTLPGVNVLSSFPRSTLPAEQGGGEYQYAIWSGTSVAAPFVSGQAAALLSKDPSLGPAELSALIAGTATPVDWNNPARQGLLGWGIPDVTSSLALLGQRLGLNPAADLLAACPGVNRTASQWTTPR